MELFIYITPVVLFLSAIGLIFVNYRNKVGWIIIGVVMTLNITILILGIIGGRQLQAEIISSSQEAASLQHWKERHIGYLESILATFSTENEGNFQKLKQLADMGWSQNNERFSESFAADEELANHQVAQLDDIMSNNIAVTVARIPTDVNLHIFTATLESYGYTPAEDNGKAEGDASAPLQAANVLYYGRQVPDEDIKRISLIAIRAGIDLKRIRQTKKTTRENQFQVAFEWERNYRTRSSITVSEIVEAKGFARK